MTRIVIAGAEGKMGQALLRAANNIPGLAVAAAIDKGGDLAEFIGRADVLVDFSAPEASVPFAQICVRRRRAMVLGTTGHAPAQRTKLLAASKKIPLVWSANFSTGVNVLFWLTGKAAAALGADYDLEIIEMHHRQKKDSPSGTARTLARILAEARRQQLEKVARYGREGLSPGRAPSEIGVHSVRGGDVVGDHTVIFAATGERLELTHKASSRETFAGGALRAAQWVAGRKPGLYDMRDVLGLK